MGVKSLPKALRLSVLGAGCLIVPCGILGIWLAQPFGGASRFVAIGAIGSVGALGLWALSSRRAVPVTYKQCRRALHLQSEGMLAEALTEYERLIPRLRGIKTDEGRDVLAMLLLNCGVAMRDLGRNSDSLQLFDELAALSGDLADLRGRSYLGKALLNRELLLATMGDLEAAIQTAEEVIGRFGRFPEPSLRGLASTALLHEGVFQARAGRYFEAIAAYDRLTDQFDHDCDWTVRQDVASATYNKAVIEFRRVVETFADVAEAAQLVAHARINEGDSLMKLDRPAEALSPLDAVVQSLAEADDARLRAEAGRALTNKGNALVRMGRDEEAVLVYEHVIDSFRDNPFAAEDVAIARVNLAGILCRSGRSDEGLKMCHELPKQIKGISENLERSLLDAVARLERECADSAGG